MPSKGDEVNDILLKAAMTCSTCGGPKPCKHEQQKGETMPKDEGPLRKRVAKAIHRENDLCVRDEPWESGYECMCFPMADAAIAALQSVPSSPPPYPKSVSLDLEDYQRAAPSDAGQPAETSMASERTIALRHAYERGKKDGTAALEKLRELEAKWRSNAVTFGKHNGSYLICANALRAVLLGKL